MRLPAGSEALERVRALRRAQTPAEAALWRELRGRRLGGFKFRRQVDLRPFIVDFACLEAKLVVEADGQHTDAADYDQRRTAWLEQHGYRVLRFWNHEVLGKRSGVMATILAALTLTFPPGCAGRAPSSPCQGEEP
ncbi:MAG: endonuclease domain-containing protein [Sphingomonadaceae bacterium]|nr:endonuclease domain-containing protein [Sphingomonadaceae bacterium]